MKKTKIALGTVMAGGILAFLLSWPKRSIKYPEVPTTIFSTIYDIKTSSQQQVMPEYTSRLHKEKAEMLALIK